MLVPSSNDVRYNTERSSEGVILKILPFVNWIAPNHMSISTMTVGRAMWKKGMENVTKGSGSTMVEILENKDILQLDPSQ